MTDSSSSIFWTKWLIKSAGVPQSVAVIYAERLMLYGTDTVEAMQRAISRNPEFLTSRDIGMKKGHSEDVKDALVVSLLPLPPSLMPYSANDMFMPPPPADDDDDDEITVTVNRFDSPGQSRQIKQAIVPPVTKEPKQQEAKDDKDDNDEGSWLYRPCQEGLDCRSIVVVILTQTRGEANWNSSDKFGSFNWQEDLDLENWDGLTFGTQKRIQVDEYFELSRLYLNRLGLYGGFPEIVGSLTRLTQLNVCYNKLSSLPDSIGKLALLTMLNVAYNQLTVLPESIGELTRLTDLNVSSNLITVLPESIGNMICLIDMNLSLNQLAVLPESIGNLSSLTDLNVFLNPISSTVINRFLLKRKFRRSGLNLNV